MIFDITFHHNLGAFPKVPFLKDRIKSASRGLNCMSHLKIKHLRRWVKRNVITRGFHPLAANHWENVLDLEWRLRMAYSAPALHPIQECTTHGPGPREHTHLPYAARCSHRRRAREDAGGWAAAQTLRARLGAQKAGCTAAARAVAAAGEAGKKRWRGGRRRQSPRSGAHSAAEVASRRRRQTRADEDDKGQRAP